jgi:uncharacterized membrane protein SpoIIM required for sporulation/ABC-type transport system involved in multi-copper enzyme maturation permease subunit
MPAKLGPVFIVARRELRDQFRDWRILFPVLVLALFFPGLMNFTAQQAIDFVGKYGANIIAERFIPFLLMIVGFFPITISLVIALESFAGETERRSIEPLLSSPLEDWQLFIGKLLASLAIPILGAYLGIFTYLIGLFRVGWQADPVFLFQVVLLTTVQALVMVAGAILVSTQTTSVRAANLLASFIVIPMALLIQAEAILMFWADYSVLWWVILAELVASVLLIRTGLAYFNREHLLGAEIDALNLRQNWNTFRQAFVGEAHSLSQWLTREIPRTLRSLVAPLVISTVLLAASLWLGMHQAQSLALPPEVLNLNALTELDTGVVSGLRAAGFYSLGGAAYVWFHNLRVVAIATLLGIFTFGVVGLIIMMLPLALLGFLAQAAAGAGLSPWTFLAAFTLPHGFLEYPALILSSAVILRLGATLITPSRGLSLSVSAMRALAEWARILLAIVIPLFFIAALVEMFITPSTMLMVLGQ